MKLTFAIPAYNEEKQIGGCLESIKKEMAGKNYDIEIIVVNNASTDRTSEVALSYPGVQVVDQPKKGLTWARHAGFLAATGDLIANIDADTRLPKGWLDRVYREFNENEKLVALSGPYIYYDLPPLTGLGVKAFYWVGYLTYIFNHFILRRGAMLQGGNFIVKKEAMQKIGGYDLEIDFYGEDTDIAKRIQKIGRVKFTFDLPMYTSGRRLAKEGIILTAVRYAVNYFWITIFRKPFSKEYNDIRE